MKSKFTFLMVLLLGLSGLSCQQGQYSGPAVPNLMGPNTVTGLVTGAGLGALAGGLIANHHKVGAGIAKGAVAGGIIGGLVGYGQDSRSPAGDIYTGASNNNGYGAPAYGYTAPAMPSYTAPAQPGYSAGTGYDPGYSMPAYQ